MSATVRKSISLFFLPLLTLSLVAVLSALEPSVTDTGSQLSNVGMSTGLTLSDCFQMALAQNETIKIRQEDILQAQARARSAIGSAYPRIAWNFTELYQDTSGLKTNSDGSVGGTLTKDSRSESKFTLEQPIFAGLRNFSAMSGFKREGRRDELLFKRASMELFGKVASSFYEVIAAETDLNNTQTTLRLAKERVRELRERAQLGKSRESEVVSAASRVASLQAQEVHHKSEVLVQRYVLSFITGKDLNQSPLIDSIGPAISLLPLGEALKKSALRSDLLAQEQDMEVNRYQVRYEKGAYWPKSDLTGNYYTQRSGFQHEIDWDLLFTLDIPLYQGGQVKANVREAVSRYRQSKFEYQMLARKIEMETKQNHQRCLQALDESRLRESAYSAAKRSYEMQVVEYRRGLVNNLDVIQALDTMQAEKITWDRAVLQTKLNWLQVKTTIEDIQ